MTEDNLAQVVMGSIPLQEPPYRVLIIDDAVTIRSILHSILKKDGMEVYEAGGGREGIRLIENQDFDAILLDLEMPDMDGFAVCQHIRKTINNLFLPILVITATEDVIDRVFQMGATDYIPKPVREQELLARVRSAVERKRLTDHLHDTENVLFGLARTIDMRDMHDSDHCERLADMCREFGEAVWCTAMEIETLCQAAWLHDIGKISIPDPILLKHGALTDKEWGIVHKHPLVGENICLNFRSIPATLQIIRHHHERWDGKGYPDELAGDDIPRLALIFQLLDAFDALVSERPYKAAYSPEQALDIMQEECEEGRWSPHFMEYFVEYIEEKYLDS